jgi:two-component system, NarL family, sensor kinase
VRQHEAVTITESPPDQGVPSPPAAPGARATLLLIALGAVAAGLALEFTAGADGIANPFLPVLVAAALLDSVLGHLIGRRHPGHPLARVLQVAGLLGGAVVLTGGYANAALFGPLPDSGATLALWLSRWLWVPASAVSMLGLLLLFPDGRLPSPRWRTAAALAAVGPALLALVYATLPFTETVWQDVSVENALAVLPTGASDALNVVAHAGWVFGVAVGSAAVVVRRRRAVGAERARYRLVVVPAVLLPPALVASWLTEIGGLAEMVVATWLAIAVTVAMLRHRMFDLDVVVNRAAVHALLVLSLFGAYVTIVALVSEVVGGDVSWPAGAVAALVVAAVTGPLLSRLRTGVDRLM